MSILELCDVQRNASVLTFVRMGFRGTAVVIVQKYET
jgi:hypothetical protein